MSWVVILIFIVVLLMPGLLMLAFEKARYAGKAILSITITIMGFIAALAVLLITAMTGTPLLVLLASIACVGLIVAAAVCGIWGYMKNKKVWISLLLAFVVCAAGVGGYFGHKAWKDSIPTVGESDSILYDYRPVSEDTKVALLDEPSTLRLEDEDLPRMDGATALYPVYSAFSRAVYPTWALEDNPYRNAYVTCNTTTRAYINIVTGEADIIFVAGPSEEQMQYAADNGVELVFTPIGREAFVFFVNARNPLTDITYEQIQAIYSGEITKWEELGVDGLGKIRPFQRDKGSGSQSALERLMAGKTLIDPPREDVVDGMGGIITQTADYRNYKNAIGFSFRFYSTEMVKNDQIKLLSINGIAPTLENIENGTYPIASEFYAVTRSDADENTLRLLEWIQGEQGQELVEKTGYTPVG